MIHCRGGFAGDHVAHMSGGSGDSRTLPSFTARNQYRVGTGAFDAKIRACDAMLAIGVLSTGAPPVGSTGAQAASVKATAKKTARSIGVERYPRTAVPGKQRFIVNRRGFV